MAQKLNVIGHRYGRLVVEADAEPRNGIRYVVAKCDCGTVKTVHLQNIKRGAVNSCGCVFREYLETAAVDSIGKRYGRLVVESDAGARGGNRYVVARCDCGETKTVKLSSVSSGKTKSCGCLHRETAAKLNKIDVIGHRYGRLLVEAEAGKDARGSTRVAVLCDCGTRKTVGLNPLRSGKTTSCGCRNLEVARELIVKRSTTHGMSKSSTYHIWNNMWARCTNTNNQAYQDYGGRGIDVCDRWQTFENFLADMGERPRGMSIDRRNNDLGYEPENCRWATTKEQSRNTRANFVIEFRGVTACLAEHCERLGLAYKTISSRIYKHGWTVEKALSAPVRRWPSQRPAGVADEREGL